MDRVQQFGGKGKGVTERDAAQGGGEEGRGWASVEGRGRRGHGADGSPQNASECVNRTIYVNRTVYRDRECPTVDAAAVSA